MNKRTYKTDAERQFYDEYARHLNIGSIDIKKAFPSCSYEYNCALRKIGDIKGKTVLDLGCGEGDASAFFGLKGARVYSVDVSVHSLRATKELAAFHSIRTITQVAMRAEELAFRSGSFDVIYGEGILHHIDLERALPEIARVLKQKGKAIFIEPQRGSIFIDIYRFFASDIRTPTEKPIDRSDRHLLERYFAKVEYDEFHLISLVLFAIRYVMLKIGRRISPYWMDEIRKGQFLQKLYRILQSIDRFLLSLIRALRKYTWIIVVELRKEMSEQ